MDVLIAGGGTGGHLVPGSALAEEVRRRDPDARVLFVGSPNGLEKDAVPRAGFDLELLPVSGLRRMGLWGLIKGLFRVPVALVKAIGLVRRFRPQVAVSCGGYAAGPAVLASRLCGVPCAVMEQNTVPGFTNKVLGHIAQLVVAALPVSGFDPRKVRVLGNPVRADLLAVRESPYEPAEPLRLLIFGGSQGARALNEAMMGLCALEPGEREILGALRILHQTGKADHARVSAAYEKAGVIKADVRPFIHDMAAAYAEADLVLARSGATTIAELTVCGRPAILVPFPFAVDDHQTQNARTLERAKAAICLPQDDLTPVRLRDLLSQLASDRDRLLEMAAASLKAGHPEAAQSIADALEGLADAYPPRVDHV